MSTRAIVRVIETNDEKVTKKCDVYHHWDGYPEYLGEELLYNFFNEKKRLEFYSVVNHLLKECKGYEFCNGSSYLGIEFIYVINVTDRSLNIYNSYECNINQNVLKYAGQEFFIAFTDYQNKMYDPEFKKAVNEKFLYDYPDLVFENIQSLTVLKKENLCEVIIHTNRIELFNVNYYVEDIGEAWIHRQNLKKDFYQKIILQDDYYPDKKIYKVQFKDFDEAKVFAESFGKQVNYL